MRPEQGGGQEVTVPPGDTVTGWGDTARAA